MKEIDLLKQTFELLEFPEDIPIDPFLSDTPNEGQTFEFIEWMKTKPESLQANFLSFLLPYRKECIPRLLELTDSRDEEVSLIAFEALIRVDEYYTWAKGKLHQGFLNEIENHPNDRRILILHSLMGGFVYVAEKEGIEILHFFRELALKHKAATIVEWLNYRIPDSN